MDGRKHWRENGVDGDYEVTRPDQARCSLLDGRLTTERWEAAAAARRCDDVTVARCRDEMTAQTAQLHGPAGLDTGLIYISHPQHQSPQPTPPTQQQRQHQTSSAAADFPFPTHKISISQMLSLSISTSSVSIDWIKIYDDSLTSSYSTLRLHGYMIV